MEWMVVPIFIAFCALFIIVAARMETRRTEAWKQVAQDIGYEFAERGEIAALPGATAFKIFGYGHDERVKNVVTGAEGPAQVTLCDFQYTTGSGKNASTHDQTLCLVDTPEVHVPSCFARPQNRFADAIGRMFGGQDIDFAEDPAFSAAYVLQGKNEGAVRETFDDKVREYFVAHRDKRWVFEASRGQLCLYTQGRLAPDQAASRIADALEILGVLRGAHKPGGSRRTDSPESR